VSPSNNRVCLCLFIFLCLFAGPVFGQDELSGEKHSVIRFFQDHISGADGNRCPMTPSCSAYAAHAVEKHGRIIGSVMALDRILRCGRSETHLAPRRWIAGESYFYDPVSANDFWWFTPPSEKKP
jgi:uncharacterized protein